MSPLYARGVLLEPRYDVEYSGSDDDDGRRREDDDYARADAATIEAVRSASSAGDKRGTVRSAAATGDAPRDSPRDAATMGTLTTGTTAAAAAHAPRLVTEEVIEFKVALVLGVPHTALAYAIGNGTHVELRRRSVGVNTTLAAASATTLAARLRGAPFVCVGAARANHPSLCARAEARLNARTARERLDAWARAIAEVRSDDVSLGVLRL